MTIKHAQVDIHVDGVMRDGDFDAILTKKFIIQPETDYVIWHKLGRKPRRYRIEWKDCFCDFYVVRDAQGNPMEDSEKSVLNFSEANATLLLWIA